MKYLLTTSLSVLAVTAMMSGAQAQSAMTKSTTTTSSSANTAVVMSPSNEMQYRTAVMGPSTVSLMTSQLAMTKATDPNVKMFAKFEAAEQTAMGKVLKDLKTPMVTMTAKEKAMMDKLKSMPAGAAFDKAFMMGQVDTHKMLQSITQAYLNKANMGSTNMMEKEAQHLATVSLATINEHIAVSSNMMSAMK